MQPILQPILNGIINAVKPFFSAIQNLFQAFSALLKGDWQGLWTALQNMAANLTQAIKNVVSGAFQSLSMILGNVWNAIKNTATNVWNGIKNAIVTPIENAKNTVLNVINTIKDWFANLKLPEIKLPKIKLPHFKITGSFSLNPPSVPRISVEWYDKGGIFYKPSIIGVAEKRPEVVGALEDIRDLFRDTLINTLPRLQIPNTVAYAATPAITTTKQNINNNVKYGDVHIDIRVERIENEQHVNELARRIRQEVENMFATMGRKSGLSLGISKGF